jgi:hypothetical protein
MTHIALADGALFWFLVVMTLLLVMFIGAIIMAPPAGPAPTHAMAPEPPAPEPVGAGNSVASCDLRVFVDQAAEPVPAQHPVPLE